MNDANKKSKISFGDPYETSCKKILGASIMWNIHEYADRVIYHSRNSDDGVYNLLYAFFQYTGNLNHQKLHNKPLKSLLNKYSSGMSAFHLAISLPIL